MACDEYLTEYFRACAWKAKTAAEVEADKEQTEHMESKAKTVAQINRMQNALASITTQVEEQYINNEQR